MTVKRAGNTMMNSYLRKARVAYLNAVSAVTRRVSPVAYQAGYGDGYDAARQAVHASAYEAFQRGIEPEQWAMLELDRDIMRVAERDGEDV